MNGCIQFDFGLNRGKIGKQCSLSYFTNLSTIVPYFTTIASRLNIECSLWNKSKSFFLVISRRPPMYYRVSLLYAYTIAAFKGSSTKIWDLSLIQKAFHVAPKGISLIHRDPHFLKHDITYFGRLLIWLSNQYCSSYLDLKQLDNSILKRPVYFDASTRLWKKWEDRKNYLPPMPTRLLTLSGANNGCIVLL